MELLAPVGSKESFITAVRAGANAVYMGVPDFNARVSAANINHFDLKVLTDFAHEKGVKVFLALNTLIKHEEINDVVKSLSEIEEISPDAVIVQDLGIANIIKNYFPKLTLHASTQLAVHNSMGVEFLAKQGFKRAILARELSFSELKIISNNSSIDLEIFCHGALCFCISGMCLFSSFIGGLSGNRGRCTQPCRRLWKNAKNHGYLFSPRDLELAEFIPKLKKIGIKSLKIEGRMRSSEYVYRVVKAYRMLIDAKENDFAKALIEAKSILLQDSAREKTTCFFSGKDEKMFEPKKAQCLGNLIGSVLDTSGANLTIELEDNMQLLEGDRLRVSNPGTDKTIAFKVKEFSKEGKKYSIPFAMSREFSVGNPVYKTIDTAFDQKDLEKEIDSIYEGYKKNHPMQGRSNRQLSQTYTALISNTWKEIKNQTSVEVKNTLWIRFENISWLDILPKAGENIRHVFYLTRDNMHTADKIPANTVVELPPFIGEREQELFKQCIDRLVLMGVDKWVLNNVSQFGFFNEGNLELTAGHFLYTFNAYTAAFLSDLGVKYFTASWEDDFLNIRKICGPGAGKFMLVYLYGYPPVVRSRLITKDMLTPEIITDHNPLDGKHSASLVPVFESGFLVLTPEKAVNIFTAQRKLGECGISNFGIDLNYIKPDNKLLASLLTSYKSAENIDDSVKFNFKRGIK
jgi:putative protease